MFWCLLQFLSAVFYNFYCRGLPFFPLAILSLNPRLHAFQASTLLFKPRYLCTGCFKINLHAFVSISCVIEFIYFSQLSKVLFFSFSLFFGVCQFAELNMFLSSLILICLYAQLFLVVSSHVSDGHSSSPVVRISLSNFSMLAQ